MLLPTATDNPFFFSSTVPLFLIVPQLLSYVVPQWLDDLIVYNKMLIPRNPKTAGKLLSPMKFPKSRIAAITMRMIPA